MTNEEAIEIIKFHIPRGAINAGVNIDIRKTDDEMAFDLAIQALEKQIAREQISNWKGLRECPICEKQVEWGHNYCPKCGQKLYWSDE